MTTITYCKGLPTPSDEMNTLGFTTLEMFLSALSPILRRATVETVNHLLNPLTKFAKSNWNTHLQQNYQLNKRYCNGVIVLAKGQVDSAKECRIEQIKQLEGKLKSAKTWLNSATKKLKKARSFYAKKNWANSQTGCNFPLSCTLDNRRSNWWRLKFQIHHKKRYINRLENQIFRLKVAPLKVKIPHDHVFIVGSKDETCGNQVCQWDGSTIKLRVPNCLESQFGKSVTSRIGDFKRQIDRFPPDGAKTWHFYRKQDRWVAAVQFTPHVVKRVSRPVQYGCIGIDLNPSSIGWAYVDHQGNLRAKGAIPLESGLPRGKQNAQIVDACLQLAHIANTFAGPIVCERLDFSTKKAQLRERGNKYARMLSSWAYSRFFELLESILANRGLSLIKRNPAYTSLIGLVKYVRMYGLPSDIAAALAIARRGMNLSERLPRSVSANLEVNPRLHVWSAWNQLNKLIGRTSMVNRRHDYYSVSNWGMVVKDGVELVAVDVKVGHFPSLKDTSIC